ncbi:MAG: chemotaxis-specific protein-glutamate methyltransferase CheB [Desulfococcaceae bacterium]|jgi:two-component system chemotaxis response regulator CheB|nr:chemotaxis-specific protein-glutamate methyltransferase CheB [Desulfococcaceae bacterium]
MNHINYSASVLIVDDSRIFRSLVEDSLKEEEDIRVIGSVRNGIKALEFIAFRRPDIVTLDLEMPDMDGLETLRAIREINRAERDLPPIGVIMLSIFTRKGGDITMKALEEGAFDFITKPEGKDIKDNIESLRRQLLAKIRFFTSRRIASRLHPVPDRLPLSRPGKNMKPAESGTAAEKTEKRPLIRRKQISGDTGRRKNSIQALLIGISTGGPKALMSILPPLCEKISIPVFIVQHMPPTFTASLAGSLNAKCAHTVTEAVHKGIVAPENIYIAPGGKHLLLRRHRHEVMTMINEQPPDKGCRPSANVLFRSALPVYGGDVIALVMTGMGADGSKGIAALKRAGACIFAQDESSSVVWGMPGSAVATGCVDRVLPLGDIPEAVAEYIRISEKRIS